MVRCKRCKEKISTCDICGFDLEDYYICVGEKYLSRGGNINHQCKICSKGDIL
jgi:hypothetical protein